VNYTYQARISGQAFHLMNSGELSADARNRIINGETLPIYTMHNIETGQVKVLTLTAGQEPGPTSRDYYVLTDEPNETEKAELLLGFYATKEKPLTTLRITGQHSEFSWNLDNMHALRCTVGTTWPSNIKTPRHAISFLIEKIRECLASVNNADQEDPGSCLKGAETAAEIIGILDTYADDKLTVEESPK
jgi:hypothetical protein